MLVPLNQLISDYNLNLRGVIHIGGHRGQEYSSYISAGIKNIIFVEPHPTNFEILKKNVGKECQLFQTALGNREGEIEMYVEESNQGQSNSCLEPHTHLLQYPQIQFLYMIDVPITKLDILPFNRSNFNFINIDVQGYELEVFKGGIETLKHIDVVYSEVNRDELYKGCAHIEEIDEFLGNFGFKRRGVWFTGILWGDAIYTK